MSKILVGYATGTGCTAEIAEHIGAALTADGADVDVRSFDEDPAPEGYDAVVAGSGVRAGSWHPAAKKWVARHARELDEKPLALFTVCIALAQGPQQTAEALSYTDKMLSRVNLHPRSIGTFAGRYYAREFNPLIRRIMKSKGASDGDFRNWDAIAAWATSVMPTLGQQPAVHV